MTLLQLFLPAVLLVLAQSTQPDPIQWKCLYQTAVGFTIKSKHQASTSNTCSLQSCIETHCEDVKYCAVTFNTKSGQCIGMSDMAVDQVSKLAESGDLMEESKGWMVIVSEEVKVSVKADTNKQESVIQKFSRAAFWPLDSENKSRNLGIKGEDLNMDVPGVDWNSKGPNGSERKFARFSEKSKRARVQLKKDGELALNLTSFTIAAWIKRDEDYYTNFLHGKKGLDIYFTPYEINVDYHIGSRYTQWTAKYQFSSSTKYSWHHFAFVSEEDKTRTTIYVDGKPLKAKKYSYDIKRFNNPPTKLEITFYDIAAPKNYLVVGMACFYISEATLKPAEVNQLKNSCP